MQGKFPNTGDIARQLGLSRATVSNVINGKGRVSADTRKRVEKALRESGFVRDQSAVVLKTGKSRMVGVLVTDISNPFYGNVVSDLEARLSDEGYSTVLGQSLDDKERQARLLTEFVGAGVAGLVINPCHGTVASDLEIVSQRLLPSVFFVREVAGCELPFVSLDDCHAGAMIAEHLVGQGYSRLAVIGGFQGTTSFDRRLQGIQTTLSRLGREQPVVCSGPITEEFGYEEASRLIIQENAIDAVIGHNDLIAIGCLRAALDLGCRVGAEFGVAGFDDLAFGRMCNPALTTIGIKGRGIGAEVGAMLLEELNTVRGSPRIRLLEPSLIERASSLKSCN